MQHLWFALTSSPRKLGMLMLIVAALLLPDMAAALQEPRPIATDYRIRTVRYSPNEIFKFLGHYGYQSSIEFSAEEKIQTISIGDSVAWLIDPAGNRLFIKPIEQDATTNMTVITDKRIYHFELHARETENIRDTRMMFVMRFMYPEEDYQMISMATMEQVPDIEADPHLYNLRYSLQGSELVSPIRIFDDGRFTYMQFPNKNAEVPAIFHVDALGNEELVNFRTRGDYIVVERVSPIFTLRRGGYIVCVYNEAMRHEPVPEPPRRTFLERMFN
jgi:type IV secretion system protein VirB9